MAMMVVLLPASEAEPLLRPAAVSELARLGVTSLALAHEPGWRRSLSRAGRSSRAARRRRWSKRSRVTARAPGPSTRSPRSRSLPPLRPTEVKDE